MFQKNFKAFAINPQPHRQHTPNLTRASPLPTPALPHQQTKPTSTAQPHPLASHNPSIPEAQPHPLALKPHLLKTPPQKNQINLNNNATIA